MYITGQSAVLRQIRLSPDKMDNFYERVKTFPNVSNRVPPTKPTPRAQDGFRESKLSCFVCGVTVMAL
jgi:hypothetical protein